MSNILIKNTDIDFQSLKLIKNGDIGTYGKIYRLNENECVKIYYVYHDKRYMINYKVHEIIHLTKIDIPGVINPKKIIVKSIKHASNEDAIGYVMNYIDGTNLYKIDNMKIKIFLEKFKELFEIIKEISNEKIRIEDCHLGNIMINNKDGKMNFIDIDDWYYDNKDKKEIFHNNFCYVNNSIMSRILSDGYYKVAKQINENTDIVDFYSTFLEKESDEKKVKLKTIKDLKHTYKGKYYGDI